MPSTKIGHRRQRSSLKVNLSCASSTTGNSNDNSLAADISVETNADDVTCYNIAQINPVTEVERINRDSAVLNRKCEILKNIILAKTKNLFNEQDDLSLKTCKILCQEKLLSVSDGSNNMETVVPIANSIATSNKDSDVKQPLLQRGARGNCRDTSSFTYGSLYRKTRDESSNKLDESSVDSAQTSLDVNTSIDRILDGKCKDIGSFNETGKCMELDNNQRDSVSVVLDGIQESSTISTSLQMNTSLYRLESPQQSTNTIDDFTAEGTRPIDREECGPPENNDLVDSRNKLHKGCNDSSARIIFGESSAQLSNNDADASTVIEKSLGKSKSREDQNIARPTVDPGKTKRKKRLLPLCESSQLVSISPVQKECSPPRCLVFRKRHNRKGIKGRKRNSNENEARCDRLVKNNNNVKERKETRKQPRKVMSKKIVVKKIIDTDLFDRLGMSSKNGKDIDTSTPTVKRRSSNEFQPLKKSAAIGIPKRQRQKIYIVATGFNKEDKSIVQNVVKALGFASIESNVTRRTTHVVTTGIRTINLLHGIIRGCWLVSIEWVFKSLENNAWIDPREYEMAHFSKAVMENRKDRQLFGSSYVPELFAACGTIYVHCDTTPPCHTLKDLIKTAGGSVTEYSEHAKIIVGQGGLRENWVLDCITSGELQPFDRYRQP